MDERLNQRLEEQLSEAHARNGDLVQRLNDLCKEAEADRAKIALVADQRLRLEAAESTRKAAEQRASAAERKASEAERAHDLAEEKSAKLRAKLELAREELDGLHALEDAIAKAKGIDDLFAA
jgi:hypothetical protein